jgi:hypothetical protein
MLGRAFSPVYGAAHGSYTLRRPAGRAGRGAGGAGHRGRGDLGWAGPTRPRPETAIRAMNGLLLWRLPAEI